MVGITRRVRQHIAGILGLLVKEVSVVYFPLLMIGLLGSRPHPAHATSNQLESLGPAVGAGLVGAVVVIGVCFGVTAIAYIAISPFVRGDFPTLGEVRSFVFSRSNLWVSFIVGLFFLIVIFLLETAFSRLATLIGKNTAAAGVIALLTINLVYPLARDVLRVVRAAQTSGVWLAIEVDDGEGDDDSGGEGGDLVIGNPFGRAVYDVRVAPVALATNKTPEAKDTTLIDLFGTLLPQDNDLIDLLKSGIPRLPAEGKRYAIRALPAEDAAPVTLEVSWTEYLAHVYGRTGRSERPSTISPREVAVLAERRRRRREARQTSQGAG